MSDMYGIVLCTSCKRKRIIDLSSERSVCPYCSKADAVGKMTVLFADRSQSVVRDVFNRADSSKYPDPRKRCGEDHDPVSTLIYRYEHASGTFGKLTTLAKGLTDIRKEFSEYDIEELFPGKGEQMLKQMISADIVIEIRFGWYKAL